MLIFDADDARDSLVFMHVPKCAGAAIHSHLEKCLRRRRDGKVRVMWGVRGDVDLAHLTLESCPHYVDWYRLRHFFKFAFVRNPYDRVLSAYRWQRERPRYAHNYEAGLEQCLSRVLNAARSGQLTNSREFVHFWPGHYFTHAPATEISTQTHSVGVVPARKRQRSDSREFNEGDGHACKRLKQHNGSSGRERFCERRRDGQQWNQVVEFVGKLENIDTDFAWLLQELGLPAQPLVAGHKENVRRNPRAKPTVSELLRREHTAESIRLTNELYRVDFELYGYPMVDPVATTGTSATSAGGAMVQSVGRDVPDIRRTSVSSRKSGSGGDNSGNSSNGSDACDSALRESRIATATVVVASPKAVPREHVCVGVGEAGGAENGRADVEEDGEIAESDE